MAWVIPSCGSGVSSGAELEMSLLRERIPAAQRLRSVADFARVRAEGRPVRGTHCLVVVVTADELTSRVAFVASRKAVGGAVQRNRARRRLREIVRRYWPRVRPRGIWLMFVAFRSTLTAPHTELTLDIERIMTRAGALVDSSAA